MILDPVFIGNQVRNVRIAANQSQEEFAEQINTTARTVSNIENGTVIPSLQTVVDIAESFNCTIESIVRKE